MKAMAIKAHGGPEVFEMIDVPEPVTGKGRVVIKVEASSVNPIDCKIRAAGMGLCPDFPAILHGDCAGTVIDAGTSTRFRKGDKVFGLVGGAGKEQGTLVQFKAVDERLIAYAPKNIPLAEAAALPVVALTAYEALVVRAQLLKGENVLILGATGGVGRAACQIATSIGANVTATVSARSMDFIKALGIKAFDYHDPDFATKCLAFQPEGFDLVLDCVGRESLDRAFQLARPGGRVAAIAARSTHDLSALHGKGLTLHVILSLLPILGKSDRSIVGQNLLKVARLVESGALRPSLHEQRFKLEGVAQAHRLFESGTAMGKILIEY